MNTHDLTYGLMQQLHRACGRSALARSDTAGNTISHAPPPRSTLVRPPRERYGQAQRECLVRDPDSGFRRSTTVQYAPMRARSDTADAPMLWPMVRLFPWPHCRTLSTERHWRETTGHISARKHRWSTPPIRNNVPPNSQGSSPPMRDIDIGIVPGSSVSIGFKECTIVTNTERHVFLSVNETE